MKKIVFILLGLLALTSCHKNGVNLVTGDYTWTVVNTDKNTSYKLSFYTYDPNRKIAVRVGSEDIADPTDERVLTVLKGFAFKPVE